MVGRTDGCRLLASKGFKAEICAYKRVGLLDSYHLSRQTCFYFAVCERKGRKCPTFEAKTLVCKNPTAASK